MQDKLCSNCAETFDLEQIRQQKLVGVLLTHLLCPLTPNRIVFAKDV
jgi:hypothetical protein